MKTIGVYVNVGRSEIKDIPNVIQKIKNKLEVNFVDNVRYFYLPVRSDLDTPIESLFNGDDLSYVGFVSIGNMNNIQEITEYFNIIKEINSNSDDISLFPVRSDLGVRIQSFSVKNENTILVSYVDVGNLQAESEIQELLNFSVNNLTTFNKVNCQKIFIPIRRTLEFPIQIITI